MKKSWIYKIFNKTKKKPKIDINKNLGTIDKDEEERAFNLMTGNGYYTDKELSDEKDKNG